MRKEVEIVSDSILNKANYTALEYSYLRAFRKKGFECELTSFKINPYIYFFISKYYPRKLKTYLSYIQKPLLRYLKHSKKRYVFIIKGYYLLPETIEEIKAMDKFIFCFYPDDPYRISPGTSNLFVQQSIDRYNAYFIWSKSLVNKISGNNVFYLPFAGDDELFKPTTYTKSSSKVVTECDVSFVGNADKERTEFFNSLGLKLAGDYNKIIYGSWWNKINSFVIKDKVNYQDFIDAIYLSKINLNVLRVQNKNSNNMRTFEIPTIGGFMLHEYSEEAMEYFEPGVEADYFGDAVECADKIKYYLKRDSLRNKIARLGQEKIITGEHLYTDRIDEIWKKVTALS